MSHIAIVAEGRGGVPGELETVRNERHIRQRLVSGDLAHMALAAFAGAASTVTAVRVNRATPAYLDFRDVRLEARNPGQVGNATLVRRIRGGHGADTIIATNVVQGITEHHRALPSRDAARASLDQGDLLTASPPATPTKKQAPFPLDAPSGAFLDEGAEGPDATPDDWLNAVDVALTAPGLEALVLGTSVAEIVQAAAERSSVPVVAGPRHYPTKAEVIAAAIRLARGAPGARVVCNTVVALDLQTERPQDYPAYHLAAFAAAVSAAGVVPPVRVTLLRLAYHFSDHDVARLDAAGVLTTRFDADAEVFVLPRAAF